MLRFFYLQNILYNKNKDHKGGKKMERRLPIGIELVRKGVITENDIQKALEYQKTHTNKKMGDILNELRVCDSYRLIQAIGEILGEKAILLEQSDIKINLIILHFQQLELLLQL